jgi:hypothetical protein
MYLHDTSSLEEYLCHAAWCSRHQDRLLPVATEARRLDRYICPRHCLRQLAFDTSRIIHLAEFETKHCSGAAKHEEGYCRIQDQL